MAGQMRGLLSEGTHRAVRDADALRLASCFQRRQMEAVISNVLRKGRALLRRMATPPISKSFPCGSALGANLVPQGVKFAVHAPRADAVHVCLFDPAAPSREVSRLAMERDETGVWHALATRAAEGTLYGFRARGKWNAAEGLWFNA